MLGVLAQKAQIYSDGIVRCVMLTHWPWTYISHDSLGDGTLSTHMGIVRGKQNSATPQKR
jgi:hypothetical protein